jgi:hypothetical protein
MKIQIEEIHHSLVNGQSRQALSQMEEVGFYNFFYEYKNYLDEVYLSKESVLRYFEKATLAYVRSLHR